MPPAAAAVSCALVAACAAIRLARFNVSPKDGRFFCGVPTTMAAAVLALTVAIGVPVPGLVMVAGVALLAFAMVSSFPYAKLARLLKLPPWLWLAPVDRRAGRHPAHVRPRGGGLPGQRAAALAAPAPYRLTVRVDRRGAARGGAPASCAGVQRQRAMTVAPPTTLSPGPTSGSAASAGR